MVTGGERRYGRERRVCLDVLTMYMRERKVNIREGNGMLGREERGEKGREKKERIH